MRGFALLALVSASTSFHLPTTAHLAKSPAFLTATRSPAVVAKTVRKKSVPVKNMALPALSYAGLFATTAGSIKLMALAGMTAWMPWVVMAYGVGLPVALVSFQLLKTGGPGVAEGMGGVPADARLTTLADKAARAVGVSAPQHVYEIPSREPNAFAASSLSGGDGTTVAVTSGLRQLLNEQELCAVLAHEMGHLRHRDVGSNMHLMIAIAGLGGIYDAGRMLMNTRSSSDDDEESGGTASVGLMLVGLGLGSQAVAHLVRLAASRGAELKADLAAAEGFGANGLISALRKIDQAAACRPADLRESSAGRQMAFAMISDGPSDATKEGKNKRSGLDAWLGKIGGVLRTHPPLDERIDALQEAAENGIVPFS